MNPPRRREDGEPAFAEPWQAEAYAMAQTLIESGRIAASEWPSVFGAALRKAAGRGEADTSEAYYAALVEALMSVLVARGRARGGRDRAPCRGLARRIPQNAPWKAGVAGGSVSVGDRGDMGDHVRGVAAVARDPGCGADILAGERGVAPAAPTVTCR